MVDIITDKDVLIYTDKSLFLNQQAYDYAEVREAYQERLGKTLLVIDEAHLYMKNVMDLIISGGDNAPISDTVKQLYTDTVKDLQDFVKK